MKTSLIFLTFFCAIVVIDGNFIHEVFRRKADLAAELQQATSGQNQQTGGQTGGQPDQSGGQQGQSGGQQGQGQQSQDQGLGQGKEAVDCFKFNTDSHLSMNDKDCRLTTTILRNDTHKAFCDIALLSSSAQGNSSQGSSVQSSPQGSSVQGSSQFAYPILSCKVDDQGTLYCWSGSQAPVVQGSPVQSSPVQGNATQVQGSSNPLTDILGKTFTGCFLYKQDELNQASQSQSTDQEGVVEWVCVRRKPNQPTIGIVGFQQQQQPPPPQSSPIQPPPQSPQSSPTQPPPQSSTVGQTQGQGKQGQENQGASKDTKAARDSKHS
jgi:hypothetical protein